MDNKKAQEHIKRLEDELAELKSTLGEKESPFAKVLEGNKYYIVDGMFKTVDCEESAHKVDKIRRESGNYFERMGDADKTAKYLKNHYWFFHKAVKFADGYEFSGKTNNYYVCWDMYNKRYIAYAASTTKHLSEVYMCKDNANLFIEWLNEYRPDGP